LNFSIIEVNCDAKISQAGNGVACGRNFCWAFSTNFDGEAEGEIRAANDGDNYSFPATTTTTSITTTTTSVD
jgi:hypothetical protein